MRGHHKKPFMTQENVVRILADVRQMGEKMTADQWGISTRTVRRYRANAAKDPELSRVVREKLATISESEDRGWRASRARYLKAAIAHLEKLLPKMDEDHVRDLVGSIKIVGELDISATILEEAPSENERAANPREGQIVAAVQDADQERSPATIQ